MNESSEESGVKALQWINKIKAQMRRIEKRLRKMRPPRNWMTRRREYLVAVGILILAMVLMTTSLLQRAKPSEKPDPALSSKDIPAVVQTGTPTPTKTPTKTPTVINRPDLPLLDLSEGSDFMESSMLRINEPTPWGHEIIFSAGNATTIDEPVLVSLFIYNMDTKEEVEVTKTNVKFGEIYEGRMNDDWLVWLDTNQRGLNYIYEMDRRTGAIKQVKKSGFIRPQLRLFGDNLVWVEQVAPEEDRLYLHNFNSGEPIILETYQSTSYGTSPPSIYNDIVVWAYPHPEQENRSIIKMLDLEKALTILSPDDNQQDKIDQPNTGSHDDPDRIEMVVLPEGSEPTSGSEEETAYDGSEGGMDPFIIDPQGFAIYPVTNGRAIAWLNNLNPSKATLKLKVDSEQEIIDVATDVGRIFGIGDTFVVYMQNSEIILYFWEIHRYARLTPKGRAGRLSDTCVSGNVVVWYEADDPSRTKDRIRVSIIRQPEA